MNPPESTSQRNRSEIVRLWRWLIRGGGYRKILMTLVWIATLIALLYAEENWRARRAWDHYRRTVEARGEQLDLHAFISKPVPDDQNFAAVPFVQTWFTDRNNNDKRWAGPYADAESRVERNTGPYQFADLVAWKTAFQEFRAHTNDAERHIRSDRLDAASRAAAAPAVLDALSTNAALLAELQDASRRPLSRYPVEYNLDDPWAILLPHLSNVKAACVRLQLRASAELALGRDDDALRDIELILYLANSLKDEPFLISYLVRVACVQIAVQPVWEGLAQQRWSDGQLQALQARLQEFNCVRDVKHALDAERAAGVLTAELLRKHKFSISDLSSSSSATEDDLTDFAFRLAPRAWCTWEQVNYCRFAEMLFGDGINADRGLVIPGKLEAGQEAFDRAIGHSLTNGARSFNAVIHHHLLAVALLPAVTRIGERAARTQTAVDEAALACALERYRRANGAWPDRLDALAPKWISQSPHDVIAGEPYRYRRTPDNRFVLYSLGWNEKDDGGTPGKFLFSTREGDWVWSYPEK